MVGLGMLMVVLGGWSLLARWRGTLFTSRPLLRFAVAMGPSGLVAVLAGWVTTEVGRQPYTIWGHLRTADSAAPLDAAAVGVSLMAFVIVYFIVFGAGTFYILRLMGHAPITGGPDDWERGPIRTAGIAPGTAQGTPSEHGPRNAQEAR